MQLSRRPISRELDGDALVEETLTNLPFDPYGILAFIIEITLIIRPLPAPVIASRRSGKKQQLKGKNQHRDIDHPFNPVMAFGNGKFGPQCPANRVARSKA